MERPPEPSLCILTLRHFHLRPRLSTASGFLINNLLPLYTSLPLLFYLSLNRWPLPLLQKRGLDSHRLFFSSLHPLIPCSADPMD